MVLDLRLSKDWDVEMTSFLFFTLFPTLFWTALRAFGTAFGLLELREALMEPLGTIWNYLERPQGYFVLFVGRTG